MEFEEWERERPQGHKIVKLWGWISYLQKQVKVGISFIDAFIKKIKRKIHLECVPRVYLEKNLSEMVQVFFVWKIGIFSKCKA